MKKLPEEALVVFVSDSHIGGDPGCDGFESPERMRDLFVELGQKEGPVELVLAGDFFDLLLVSPPPPGTDRARITLDRPEYREMFGALRSFASGDGHRVTYMPGNHDAEVWWNQEVQETLREGGLVDEFALSYLASLGAGEKEFVVYCEHGNQFDPPNRIGNYADPLDTPLGHHTVTAFTRKIAPVGEVAPGLDLADIKNVYPLSDIPQWVASKYFYHALGRAIAYLLIPFVLLYVAYRSVSLYLDVSERRSFSFPQSFLTLPRAHEAFLDVSFFVVCLLALLAVLFLALRRRTRKFLSAWSSQGSQQRDGPTEPQDVEQLVRANGPFPMWEGDAPVVVDVFVSGHTHSPGLEELERSDGSKAVLVNSGCWLRQLRPLGSRLRWPPVFASRFVLTHARVFLRDSKLRVELWEHPKPAKNALTRTERLAVRGKMPAQPTEDAKPRVIAASELPAPG